MTFVITAMGKARVNWTKPVACTIKVYNRKFKIVNYVSVWSVTYDRNL